jgi:amino acid transporter
MHKITNSEQEKFILSQSLNQKVYTIMTKTTTIFGTLFIFIGLFGWFITDMVSFTALIPTFFGLVMVVLARLAEKKEHLRKHIMHAVVLLVLVGLLGSASGLVKFVGSLFGGELERPIAIYLQALYAALSVAFIVLAVRSFIEARRAK